MRPPRRADVKRALGTEPPAAGPRRTETGTASRGSRLRRRRGGRFRRAPPGVVARLAGGSATALVELASVIGRRLLRAALPVATG